MSLSGSDMEAAAKISSIVFPEPKKQPEAQPVRSTEPVQQAEPDNTPQETEAADLESYETDAGADDGDVEVSAQDTSRDEDAGQEPPVKPPSGLTADELEAFRALSPAAQKAWARRDQDRTKELNRVQNRLNEQQKQHDAAMKEIQAERQRLAQSAAQFGDRDVEEFKTKFGDITDPVKLAMEDPLRYLEFDSALKKLQFAQAAKQQLMHQQQQEQQQNLVKFREEQNEALRQKLNISDDDAFNKFDTEISKFLIDEGIPKENIIHASATQLAIAYDAMRWRKAQASKKAAESRVANIPAVQKPGVKRDVDADASANAALRKRLKQSGSVDDAAAVLRNMI